MFLTVYLLLMCLPGCLNISVCVHSCISLLSLLADTCLRASRASVNVVVLQVEAPCYRVGVNLEGHGTSNSVSCAGAHNKGP